MDWPAPALPYGLNGNYLLPSTFLRTALFSSMRYRGRERPRFVQKTPIACYEKKLTVYQLNGEQLDGNDLDVLASCVRCIYETTDLQEAAVSVHFEEKSFLSQMGWKTGGEQRKALAQCLERLRSSGFAFEIVGLADGDEASKNTSLIFEYTKYKKGIRTAYSVTLNRMIAMHMRRGFSIVNRMQRNELRKNSSAQWLHAFFSTHKAAPDKPATIDAEKLRPYMRRSDMRDDKWRAELREALEKLQEVTKWECTLSKDGMVTVAKPKRAAARKDDDDI